MLKVIELLETKMNSKIKREVLKVEELIKKAKRIYDYRIQQNLPIPTTTPHTNISNEKFRVIEKYYYYFIYLLI